MQTGSAEIGLSFGPFLLVLSARALYEGGRRIKLGSRALEILLALAERPGELISKDELSARLWPNINVDESALRVHVTALRKALRDDAAEPRYIGNVSGRGYRFLPQTSHGSRATLGSAHASTYSATRWGLPTAPFRIVGREIAVAAIANTFLERRLVTVTGSGGIGKTTAAVAAAERLAEMHGYDIIFVDLAPLTDPLLVPGSLSSALQLQTRSQDPVSDATAALAGRSVLILLDNCEHVVEAAALLVERVLSEVPDARVLATSREPLRAVGERIHRLRPLDLPRRSPDLTAAEALTSSAVCLFVERAQAADDTLALSDEQALSAAEICNRLDGIPLAIELAAAWVPALGVVGLASRLDDRFALLDAEQRTAFPRHRTLRATLAWSHGLLPPAEQVFLRRISVFRGPFGLDAAAAVAVGIWSAGVSAVSTELIGCVVDLVAKSMLVAFTGGPEPLYRLLETTRAFAFEALEQSGEGPTAEFDHARYVLALMKTAEREWETRSGTAWTLRYAHVIDDVRAALDWSFSSDGDVSLGVALTAASSPLWFRLSLPAEYQRRIEHALAAINERSPNELEAFTKLNIALSGALFATAGPSPQSEAAAEKALDGAARLGSIAYQLRALWSLGRDRHVRADFAGAFETWRQFSQIARDSPEHLLTGLPDRTMASALYYVGRHAEGAAYADAALSRPWISNASDYKAAREFDNSLMHRTLLARIVWVRGRHDEAAVILREGVARAVALEYPPTLCAVLSFAACPLAFWSGDMEQARTYTDLLLGQSGDPSFVFWKAWAAAFDALLRLQGTDSAAVRQDLLGSLRTQAAQAFYGDMLATIRCDLLLPETAARAVANPASWCGPEILRARTLLKTAAHRVGSVSITERDLAWSCELAREQGARSWELRSAISLARLFRETARANRAASVLAPIYESLGGGTGTADLREAASILSAL